MVILTARVIANLEMDDKRIGAVQPWWWFFFLFIRGRQRWCVGFSVLCSYSFQVGLPVITGGCGCRGSTTLAQHAQCSLCSFYSCQPTDSLLPIMYSKQCFFCVWCLFSVPVAHAAVNRLLEKLLFFLLFFKIYFCVCLVCARCHLPLSHRQVRILSGVVRFCHRLR